MYKNTRRQFLKDSGVLAAGAATLDWNDTLWPATEPQLTFPTQPRERIAVASWPFHMFIEAPANKWARDLKLPGMTLTEFPAMVVKRFGVYNIEPLDQHFPSTNAVYLTKFRAAVEKAGCHVVDIPCDVNASYYDTDPTKRRRAVENGKKWVNIAVEIGSPSIRTHLEGPAKLTPDVDRAAQSLTQLAEYGAAKNIVVALENDDNRTEELLGFRLAEDDAGGLFPEVPGEASAAGAVKVCGRSGIAELSAAALGWHLANCGYIQQTVTKWDEDARSREKVKVCRVFKRRSRKLC